MISYMLKTGAKTGAPTSAQHAQYVNAILTWAIVKRVGLPSQQAKWLLMHAACLYRCRCNQVISECYQHRPQPVAVVLRSGWVCDPC